MTWETLITRFMYMRWRKKFNIFLAFYTNKQISSLDIRVEFVSGFESIPEGIINNYIFFEAKPYTKRIKLSHLYRNSKYLSSTLW